MTDAMETSGMKLAPGVVDTIISITVSEVEGVASVGNKSTSTGFMSKFQSKPSHSGIETALEDDKLAVTLHIDVFYGYVLPELADKIRQAIYDALLVQVGIEVSRVDIFVDAIQFDSKQQ